MVPDLLIVGGGVVGLGVADVALRAGLSVTVADKSGIGQEASWAGAGMLTCRPWPRVKPGTLDTADLNILSVKLHAEWATRLRDETGIDTGHRVCGALELLVPGSSGGPEDSPSPFPGPRHQQIQRLIAGCNERGIAARLINAAEVREREPNIGIDCEGAVEFASESQTRNPWLLKALKASIAAKGGRFIEGAEISDVDVTASRVCGVLLKDGSRLGADKVALCAGAWTGRFPSVVRAAPSIGKIEPVRGQMLCYQATPDLASRLLSVENHYIVPRGDGIILIGATLERTGFDKATTADGLRELEQFAHNVLPALKLLKPLRHWAGLRPGLKGRHPIFGPVPGIKGLFLAAGHYRNGLTQAPATAELLLDLILERPPRIPVVLWAIG